MKQDKVEVANTDLKESTDAEGKDVPCNNGGVSKTQKTTANALGMEWFFTDLKINDYER